MTVRIEDAGLLDGRQVQRAVIDDGGLEVGVLAYGATLQWLRLDSADLALGFDTVEDYAKRPGHLGATAGRVANRISNSRFTLDGRTYQLPSNERGHHLHGGPKAFGHRIWQVEADMAGNGAIFTLHSPDGDNGYPGNLDASCRYAIEGRKLTISFAATSDAPTPVNLINHAYWNLSGADTVEGHELVVESDEVLEIGADLIPTGRLVEVAGTPLDYRQSRRLDHAGPPKLDNCYVLRGTGMRHAATLRDPASGRSLRVETDQPGVQVYSSVMLDAAGRGGRHYGRSAGLCLETEAFPDSVNHAKFPSTILRPGETYRHHMVITVG